MSKNKTRTYVILDGLQEPQWGQALSRRWMDAGLPNSVDVAGQFAWITPSTQSKHQSLDEENATRAANIAQLFGLEIRDRIGKVFCADNNLNALQDHLCYEYKSRFATALVFGLPAIVLHYWGPFLAGGTGDWRSMIFPWMIEFLLVGWLGLAAGWPILWQGMLSLIHLRVTADLFTMTIFATGFLHSCFTAFAAPWISSPSFGQPPDSNPMFIVPNLAIMIAVLQRWLVYQSIRNLRGNTMRMIPKFSMLIIAWLIACIIITLTSGLQIGLAVGLLLPPMIGLGGVNHWSPGVTLLLPVIAYTIFFLLAPTSLHLDIEAVRAEIAILFALLMTCVLALGWRDLKNASSLKALH